MRVADNLREPLESVAQASSFSEAANRLVGWARELTGCEAVMLRLLEPLAGDRGWIPALVHQGLSPRFLQDEALIGAEECMCGRVCLGLGDRGLPFFTDQGSFLWGRVQSIAREFPPEALGEVRGRCIMEGYDSIAVVPIKDGDKEPVGALHVADHSPHKFEAHINLLEAACRECGPLLIRHEEHDLELISALEAALFPRELPTIPGLELVVVFSSASDCATVGGDFYDVRELSDGDVLAFVGDYAGKGLEAAGTAARIRKVVSELSDLHRDPAALLREANVLLTGLIPPERFVTLLVCRWTRDGRLVAAGAGHPWPLWLLPEGRMEEVGLAGNLPLGVAEEGFFSGGAAAVPPGGTLLLYTDGISDARREGLLFGVEGISETWRECRGRGLDEFLKILCRKSESFHRRDRHSDDDRLAVALRWSRADESKEPTS